MKDTPAWQIHLANMKKELTVQEDKWDHREEEMLEIERKRAEIKRLEDEAERERSLERKRKTTIVTQDELDRQQREEEEAA